MDLDRPRAPVVTTSGLVIADVIPTGRRVLAFSRGLGAGSVARRLLDGRTLRPVEATWPVERVRCSTRSFRGDGSRVAVSHVDDAGPDP